MPKVEESGPVEFYLADYRDDRIGPSDWTWIDLTPLGHVQRLEFELSSTDDRAVRHEHAGLFRHG